MENEKPKPKFEVMYAPGGTYMASEEDFKNAIDISRPWPTELKCADTPDGEYKLFVWEGRGVLADYTDGLIVVLARSHKEAIAEIEKKYPDCINDFPHYECKSYRLDKPRAFLVEGGS